MLSNNKKIIWVPIFAISWLMDMGFTIAFAQQAVQPFAVKDDIELTRFNPDPTQAIRFSPDSHYFAVYTERGRLDLNRCESSLRFYQSKEVNDFLNRSDGAMLPVPVWVVSLATSKKCSTIN